MVDTEDHRQCHGTGGRRERKKTGRRRWRLRDFVDRFVRGIRGKAAHRDFLDRLHRRGHTIHFHPRRSGHCLDRERGIFPAGDKLQFAPTRYDRNRQPQRAAQTLGRTTKEIRWKFLDNRLILTDSNERLTAMLQLDETENPKRIDIQTS